VLYVILLIAVFVASCFVACDFVLGFGIVLGFGFFGLGFGFGWVLVSVLVLMQPHNTGTCVRVRVSLLHTEHTDSSMRSMLQ
jgi:hypothetical protein